MSGHPARSKSENQGQDTEPDPALQPDQGNRLNDPGLSATDEGTRAYYERNADSYARSTQSSDLGVLWEPFERALQPGSVIADLGCGSGRDLRRFTKSGFAAIGLDRSFWLSQIAHECANRPVVVGDLIALPFRTGSFDAAWCAATVLHVRSSAVARVMCEIRRILRPHGLALITVKEGRGDEIDEHGRHTFYYTEAFGKERLVAAGFGEPRIIRSVERRGDRAIPWLAFFARAG